MSCRGLGRIFVQRLRSLQTDETAEATVRDQIREALAMVDKSRAIL